jgi:hypothetical protein
MKLFFPSHGKPGWKIENPLFRSRIYIFSKFVFLLLTGVARLPFKKI